MNKFSAKDNVLDLSRNFCYNNNREVKARTTRRTREAMASELQLPQHYVELDQQEMMYVDGGLYIGYSQIQSFVRAFGGSGANVVGNVTAALGGLTATLAIGITAFFSWFNAIPVAGQILFCYLAANAVMIAGYMATAYVQKKGVDLSIGMCWFVPYVKPTVC